jgi:thiol-disulfide isomerase/thioredoxin
MIDARKLTALLVLGGAGGLMVGLFLWMVGPAAAREVQAACTGMRPTWSNPKLKRLPAKAPDFQVTDRDGRTLKLSDLQGKVVLVNFWASWCDVCKAEKKSLAALQRELGGKDFEVISLASDDDWELVDKSMRIALGKKDKPSEQAMGGAPFDIYLDPPDTATLGTVAAAWGLEKVPESFLIDRAGNIRMYLVNKRDWSADVVQTCVQSLIDE